MNDYDMKNESSSVGTYHATANLNTAIENPQINMNNAMGVNISNSANNNITSNFNPDNYGQNLVGNDYLNQNLSNFQNIGSDSQNQGLNQNFSQEVSSNMGSDFVQGPTQNPYQNYDSAFETRNSSSFVSNVDSDVSQTSSQFMPSSSIANNNISYESVEDNNKVVYEPTLEKKKKSQTSLTIPREVKLTAFIVFILFIFILLMPYIYDFLKQLQLVLTT